MIIYIASYPRSGNSWIQTLLFEKFRIVSSSLYKRSEEQKLFKAIDPGYHFPSITEELYTSAYSKLDEFIDVHQERLSSTHFTEEDRFFLQESPIRELFIPYGNDRRLLLSGSKPLLEFPIVRQYLASNENLFFIKTHEWPYDTYYPGEKVLHIVRNPGAVAWSYLHFLRDFDGFVASLEEIILGHVGFGDWSQYHQLWMLEQQKRQENFCLIFYEDLAKDYLAQVKKISDFIQIPIIGSEDISFEELHRIKPKLIREGKATNWEKNFTNYQLKLLWNKHKDMMSLLGYSEPDYSLVLDSSLPQSTEVSDLSDISSYEKVLEQKLSSSFQQIYDLNQQLERNKAIIHAHEEKLADANTKLENANAKMAQLDTELYEKEQVIQQLAIYQKSSIRHLVVNKIFPQIRKIKFGTRILNKLLLIKHIFRRRIFVLDQYPPREFTFPQHYRAKKVLPLNKNQPLVSIVTPSYNQVDFLEKTIQSIITQEYPNLEYIVQDGGSRDDSEKILKKHDDQITHWESKPDNGQSHAINLGFEKSRGEIMAYLNSDDILLPGTVQYVVNYFEKNPQVDAVYGHRVIIDDNDQEIGVWVLPKHDNKVLYYADYVPQETLFWRRSLWQKVGGIDETFKFAMDWDMLLRFQDAGANLVRLPRFLAAFRVHSGQKTSHQISGIGLQEMGRLQSRYFDELNYEIVNKNIKSYLRRATLHHLLFRMKLLKY